MLKLKIKLTLRCLGLAFIIPLIIAIVLCAVALGYAVHQYGILSAGALVTLASMMGFALVLTLPAIIFYTRFYGRIDDIVHLGDDATVYIVSNKLLTYVNSIAVVNMLADCLRRASGAFQGAGYVVKREMIARPLNDLIIIFTHDIDELSYYRRWGIRYTRIKGLKYSNRIIVEKQRNESIDATALDHEIFHVIVDAHDKELRALGRLHDVEKALGLEHRDI